MPKGDRLSHTIAMCVFAEWQPVGWLLTVFTVFSKFRVVFFFGFLRRFCVHKRLEIELMPRAGPEPLPNRSSFVPPFFFRYYEYAIPS